MRRQREAPEAALTVQEVFVRESEAGQLVICPSVLTCQENSDSDFDKRVCLYK